jgi:hypothetical protein
MQDMMPCSLVEVYLHFVGILVGDNQCFRGVWTKFCQIAQCHVSEVNICYAHCCGSQTLHKLICFQFNSIYFVTEIHVW